MRKTSNTASPDKTKGERHHGRPLHYTIIIILKYYQIMKKTIETRPQGYQSPAFDNDEERKQWEARALKVAKIICKQITAAPAAIWQSWAMERPSALIWEGRAGLIFRVNGLQHRGDVVVTLDEGRDLYDVATLQDVDGEIITTRQQTGVYCDDLAHVIDTMVERPEGMTDEEYIAALRALNDPLTSFLLSKAERKAFFSYERNRIF